MSVAFNQIPGSGLVAPIFTFEVNSAEDGVTESRVLIIGHKNAAGTLAANVPAPVADLQSAFPLIGGPSMLYEQVRIFRRFAPTVSLSIAHVAPVGAAATWEFTVPSIPAIGGTMAIQIGGKTVQVQAAAGDTSAAAAAKLVAGINAYYDDITRAYLSATAAAVGAVVTLTARHVGAAMDMLVRPDPNVAGNVLAGAAVTATAGTGVPVLTTLLGGLGAEPYDWIIAPFSDNTTLTSLQALLTEYGGRWAWNIQIYGHALVCKRDTSANLLTFANNFKSEKNISCLGVMPEVLHNSFEEQAFAFAAMANWLTDNTNGNAARNASGLPLAGHPGMSVPTAAWSYATRNALQLASIGTNALGAGGIMVTDKLVTFRRENVNGQPDKTFRDIQTIAVVQMGLRVMRGELMRRCANRAAVDKNPYKLAAQITPDDVKAAVLAGYELCVQRGFFENADRFARSVIVERDGGNPARFNIGMREIDVVNPADVFAGQAIIWSQTRA